MRKRSDRRRAPALAHLHATFVIVYASALVADGRHNSGRRRLVRHVAQSFMNRRGTTLADSWTHALFRCTRTEFPRKMVTCLTMSRHVLCRHVRQCTPPRSLSAPAHRAGVGVSVAQTRADDDDESCVFKRHCQPPPSSACCRSSTSSSGSSNRARNALGACSRSGDTLASRMRISTLETLARVCRESP